MNEPVITSAVRTAIGKFQGALSSLSAVDLGACVVREAVTRAGIEPAQVDEIIMATSFRRGWGRTRRARRDSRADSTPAWPR